VATPSLRSRDAQTGQRSAYGRLVRALCCKAAHDSCIEGPAAAHRRRPSEDQEALVEAARGIEAERTGVYEATREEQAAIDRGLDDVRGGRLAADEALAEVRAKFRGE
jgi:hypothetical protein